VNNIMLIFTIIIQSNYI